MGGKKINLLNENKLNDRENVFFSNLIVIVESN